MGISIIFLITALFALTNGLSQDIENLKNDFVLSPSKGNRLAGWSTVGGKCDFVRRHIKTYGYCWQDENEAKGINTQKERRWVKEVIQQWEKCGGIKFVEEPTCRQGPDFITIKVGNYHPKVVPAYEADTCKIHGFRMVLDFYTFGTGIEQYTKTEKVREAVIKMYSLHEFGHFLGFDHEHNRNDRKGECKTPVDADEVGPDAEFGNYHITKEYDPNSIMNYCRPNSHYKPYLSELDKKAIREIFGGGNQQECDVVTKPWKWGPGEGLDDYKVKELDMESKGITCFDLDTTESCVSRKSVCHHEAMRNYYCRKTCGGCTGGPVEDTTQAPEVTDAPGSCTDLKPKAECQSRKKDCSNDAIQYWCQRTCNAC